MLFAGVVAAIGSLALAVPASAALTTSSPTIPPVGGVFTSTDVQLYSISGFSLTLRNMELTMNAPITQSPSGANELENFMATLNGLSDINITGTGSFPNVPASSSGAGSSFAFGKAGPTATGTFDTEMLSLNLSGSTALGPFMIRESPTRASTGRTTITPLGGGTFLIDSFFDVFTELSIDGGQNWIPNANGSSRLTLVPEPSSVVLACIGGIAAAGAMWRRRRNAVRS